jgi:hypothetical protein
MSRGYQGLPGRAWITDSVANSVKVQDAPRAVGVDFALRKEQVYGTVLVDAETGDAIDLLPDRKQPPWRPG